MMQRLSRVWAALDRAIRAAALPCEALPGGITVDVDDDTNYEPDAIVNCGPELPEDAIAAKNPVIVVEVLSPGGGAGGPAPAAPSLHRPPPRRLGSV